MTENNDYDDDYTPEELLEMDDIDFAEAVTEDLQFTGAHDSPFQDPAIIRRTIGVLIDKIHFADGVLQRQADDASVSAERFDKTAGFRRHLIAVLDISETRLCWQEKRYSSATREARAWKKLLNLVCDELEDSKLDWILDEFTIPMRDEGTAVSIDLRTWIDIRRAKDPQRVPEKEVAA